MVLPADLALGFKSLKIKMKEKVEQAGEKCYILQPERGNRYHPFNALPPTCTKGTWDRVFKSSPPWSFLNPCDYSGNLDLHKHVFEAAEFENVCCRKIHHSFIIFLESGSSDEAIVVLEVDGTLSEKRNVIPNMCNNSTGDLCEERTSGFLNSSSKVENIHFSPGILNLLQFLMILLALVTVLGNALVIVAFIGDKNLRLRSNYFFLNLAISDFLVGAICIPLYIPYALTNRWPFGRELCKFWLVIDYLSCTASAFNIVLISYDRYQSVFNAVSYRIHQGLTPRAMAQIAAVWLLAFLVYGPAIVFWEYVKGRSDFPNGTCKVEFSSQWHFLVCTSVLEFLIPVLAVAYFNLNIYWSIRTRSRWVATLSKSQSASSSSPSSPDRAHPSRLSLLWRTCLPGQLGGTPALYMGSEERGDGSQLSTGTQAHDNGFNPPRIHSLTPSSFESKSRFKLLRDRKMAKSLSVILIIFAICWAPYSLFTIVRAACGKEGDDPWYDLAFWLMWLNSSVNPFLYPLCHKRFQKAFLKVLCCRGSAPAPQTQSLSS
ncbi:histamine H4 receptor-like [Tachyglossus aculeatus]|uniref:histamine H4 receptor-like n=1 Tax=Tachyglossus aculeatus TaxID=9261 RepID=UPI0018F3FCD6|nr:histamine H4 receptor-like [Tachyglossus aculeatus]